MKSITTNLMQLILRFNLFIDTFGHFDLNNGFPQTHAFVYNCIGRIGEMGERSENDVDRLFPSKTKGSMESC